MSDEAMLWTGSETVPSDRPWLSSKVTFPAGSYHHPASDLLQIRLIRRGSSYAAIDLGAGSQNVFTRSGDILVSLPGHATSFDIDAPREVSIIEIDADFAADTLKRSGTFKLADLTPMTVKPIRDPLIAALCRDVADTNAADDVRRWALQLMLSKLVADAKRRTQKRQVMPLSAAQLGLILKALESAPSDAHSNVNMAQLVGMPVRAFSTAFRNATGVPIHQFVLRARADAAVKMLTETSYSLAEIAIRAGFAHQAHMTRVLSRTKGKTPGQYRKISPD